MVLGSVDVPTVSAFIHAFIQQHYNPKFFIATAGPDQGAAFIKAIGTGNENGIFVPNGWYGGSPKADSKAMVKEYIAKYGGTPSGVNTDVAEAYAVGQVLTQAVNATHSFDNAKIIAYLHSGVTLDSVQGPVKFDSLGENTALLATDVPMAVRASSCRPSRSGQGQREAGCSEAELELVTLGSASHLIEGRERVSLTDLAQAVIDGMLTGGVYALMAAGLSLIFGVMDIVNIAQGVMVILGGYLSYSLSVRLGSTSSSDC